MLKVVLNKTEIRIPFSNDETITDFKRRIQDKSGIAAKMIRIICDHNLLDDNSLIHDAIGENDEVAFFTQQNCENDIILFVETIETGVRRSVQISTIITIGMLKSIVHRFLPECCSYLFDVNFNELLDERIVRDYAMRDDSIVYVCKSTLGVTSVLSGEETLRIPPSPQLTVLQMKEIVAKRIHVAARDLALFVRNGGRVFCLNEESIVATCGIGSDGMVYYAVFKSDNLIFKNRLKSAQFCTVYKGTVGIPPQPVILKQYNLTDDSEVERNRHLMSEIITLMKLGQHERIVNLVCLHRDGLQFYVGLEFMPNGSLRSLIDREGPLIENRIIHFSKQILEGIYFIHQNGIFHRDIRAASIFLDFNDNLKLSNFVLSKYCIGFRNEGVYVNEVQSRSGRSNWMAPEVLDSDIFSAKADIWSLGATIVEMITGQIPFMNLREPVVITTIVRTKRIDFKYPGNVSHNLRSFTDSCLDPEPNNRPTAEILLQRMNILAENI